MPQPEPLQNLPDPPPFLPTADLTCPQSLGETGSAPIYYGIPAVRFGGSMRWFTSALEPGRCGLGGCNTSPNPGLLFNPVSFLASSPKSHSHPVMHWLQARRQIKLSEKWMYEPTSSPSKMFLWLYFIPSFMEKVHFVPPHLQQWPHRAFCWSYFRVTVSLQQVFKIRAYRGG